MKFKNFRMWRGKLPHWRADDVHYYVTFRSSRPLDPSERHVLLHQLLKRDTKKFDLAILFVGETETHLILQLKQSSSGKPFTLEKLIEQAKSKAGQAIIEKTGERWPPFYSESYDRIVRDEAEFADRTEMILALVGDDEEDFLLLNYAE